MCYETSRVAFREIPLPAKVYLVMMYKTGENGGVISVHRTLEGALKKAEILNADLKAKGKDMWCDVISEEVLD